MSVTSYKLSDGTVRYRFVIDLGRSDDGTRRQVKRSNYVTESAAREAEAKEREAQGLNLSGSTVPRGSVQEALQTWLQGCSASLEPTTVGWYRSILNRYVLPNISDNLPLTEFGSDQRNRLYGHLRSKGLSDSTVRGVHKTLSAALRASGIHHQGVRVPRAKKPGRHGVWTLEETRRFLSAISNDRNYVAFCLILCLGIRRGELAGLRWSDIDFDQMMIRIRTQRTYVNGYREGEIGTKGSPTGVIEKEPKGASMREIPISHWLAKLLLEHRERWLVTKAEAGTRWSGHQPKVGSGSIDPGTDRVFTYSRGRTNGQPYHPSYWTHRFAVLCRIAKVPRIALHDGRHTSASLSAAMGVDIKSLQARLGHSDPKILTEVYLHLVSTASREAADRIEATLNPL